MVDDVFDVNQKEVTGLRLRNLKTGEQWDLPTSAMFLGIGHTPNARIRRRPACIATARAISFRKVTFVRSAPGVFISGDVADRHYRQAVTAAGTGCMAALEAEKYLEEIGK